MFEIVSRRFGFALDPTASDLPNSFAGFVPRPDALAPLTKRNIDEAYIQERFPSLLHLFRSDPGVGVFLAFDHLDATLTTALGSGSMGMQPEEVRVMLRMLRKECRDKLPGWKQQFSGAAETEKRARTAIDQHTQALSTAASTSKNPLAPKASRFR